MTLSGNKRAPLVCLSSARLKSTVLYLHRTRLRYTVCTPVSALCLYLGSAVHVYLMGCMCRVQYQASAVQVYLSRCIQNALMYSARWWYYKYSHEFRILSRTISKSDPCWYKYLRKYPRRCTSKVSAPRGYFLKFCISTRHKWKSRDSKFWTRANTCVSQQVSEYISAFWILANHTNRNILHD